MFFGCICFFFFFAEQKSIPVTQILQVEWQYTWQEINFDSGVGETDGGIFIKSQNDLRRTSSFKSMFSHQSKGKVLLIRDPNLRKVCLLSSRMTFCNTKSFYLFFFFFFFY